MAEERECCKRIEIKVHNKALNKFSINQFRITFQLNVEVGLMVWG